MHIVNIDDPHQGFALSFAKANAKGIVLVARSVNGLDGVVKDIYAIDSKIEVLSVPTDITDPGSVSQLWARVKSKFGHADVLVNNAGTVNGGPLAYADPKAWWSDFVSFTAALIDSQMMYADNVVLFGRKPTSMARFLSLKASYSFLARKGKARSSP